MCNVQGFFHVGVTVSDMDRSLAFYRDGLGLEFDWEMEGGEEHTRTLLNLNFESLKNVFLKIPGGGVVELLEYRGLERFSAASRPCDPGSGHMCLYVEDIDAITERARRYGGTSRSKDPVLSPKGASKGMRLIYMADPDGFIVELLQRPAEAGS